MKAPTSDDEASGEVGADNDYKFDYSDFFSVLMYYGHLSKEDIMNSSRPFLYEIYKQYGKRACENLGVSSEPKEDETAKVDVEDYPSMFKKLSAKDREDGLKEFESDEDFMKIFGSKGRAIPKSGEGNRLIEM